jgi:hypothetical protein
LNDELKEKFDNFEHKREVSKRKVKEFKEKCDSQIERYEQLYKDLVKQCEGERVQISSTVSSAQYETEDEMLKLLKHGQSLMS